MRNFEYRRSFLSRVSLRLRSLLILGAVLFSFVASCIANDEIDFFNVGQGHAVLVNRVGRHPTTNAPFVPLLVDAGSTSPPFAASEKFTWNKDKAASAVNRIGKRIVHFWETSTGGSLRGGHYQLNIIITHPDKDHKDFIPAVLQFLQMKTNASACSFFPILLLGGEPTLYSGFLEAYNSNKVFSSQCPGIFYGGNCGFLDTSGCVTHLFCPKGIESNKNRWSIITRVQLNGVSAILTGDADSTVKKEMLDALNADQNGIRSDLLLAPHHGAEGTYHAEWDGIVNPKAVVIGAAPRDDYQHPSGQTVLAFLNALGGRGRLWDNSVMPHGIQYCANDPEHQNIRGCFVTKRRLLDEVPNGALETAAAGEAVALLPLPQPQWRLAWTDLPIYTLWTTGTLYFQGDVTAPQFVDAPYGMVPYIAVTDPSYLFNPYARKRLLPLSPTERGLCDKIADLAKKRVNKQRRTQDEAMLHKYANIMMQQLFLIDDHRQRELYLTAIHTILNQDRDLFVTETFFKWLREAIVEQNTHVREDRLQSVLPILFAPWGRDEDSDIRMFLCSPLLDGKALILRTFLRSTHTPARLKDYILTFGDMTQCGPSEEEIDILCPCGFPEWRQLARLMDFVRTELINPLGESISIMDIMDISQPRAQGKNFKEIGLDIVNSLGPLLHREIVEELERHFPLSEQKGIILHILNYESFNPHAFGILQGLLPQHAPIVQGILDYEREFTKQEELRRKLDLERYFPKILDDLLT